MRNTVLNMRNIHTFAIFRIAEGNDGPLILSAATIDDDVHQQVVNAMIGRYFSLKKSQRR